MGTTATYGFPYPEGSDLVRDGNDVMAALAAAVEAALNPPWTALTLNATYTPRAGHHVPAYRVFANGRVQLRGGIEKSSNIGSGNTPLTLPAAAQPTVTVVVAVATSRVGGTYPATGRLDIAPTGVCTVQVLDAGTLTWVSLDGVEYSK